MQFPPPFTVDSQRCSPVCAGDVFLLVFSLDDRDSFHEVRELLEEIRAAKAKLLKPKYSPRVPAVICGNKADLGAARAVSCAQVTEALGADVTFFQTSAKHGDGLDAAFRALASLGGLPDETSPSRHQLVSMVTYQSLCVGQRGRTGSRARRARAPCAAVDPLARRPSFSSDLQMVLGSSTEQKKPERCQIQ